MLAAFHAEEVLPDTYFVWFERGRMLQGCLLDSGKKADKRLFVEVHDFCRDKGYTHLKLPTLGEIALDDTLSKIWNMSAGDEGQHTTSQVGGGYYGTSRHHKTQKFLLLSKEPVDGYVECLPPAEAKSWAKEQVAR